jgi:hypothetical protein
MPGRTPFSPAQPLRHGDPEITQPAVDRRPTLIAFEAMNHWSVDGGFSLHVFHKHKRTGRLLLGVARPALTGTGGDRARRFSAGDGRECCEAGARSWRL